MTRDPEIAFSFIAIAQRTAKPRRQGITMVLDKGLGLQQAEDLMFASPAIDIIKLGWATPRLFPERIIRGKIELYRRHGILTCNGGTLLESAYQQNTLDRFFPYCRDLGLEIMEVSNGVVPMSAADKGRIIGEASRRGFFVISEVGRKDPVEDHKLSMAARIDEARADLEAGAQYVIIEAREGGRDLGVYDRNGGLKSEMARELVDAIGVERIMFEAPAKSQQAGLILLFGRDVNLGNIRPEDIIPLETLRLGIRGDTIGKL